MGLRHAAALALILAGAAIPSAEYDVPQFERLRGVATYSNHRLLRTAGRIIGP